MNLSGSIYISYISIFDSRWNDLQYPQYTSGILCPFMNTNENLLYIYITLVIIGQHCQGVRLPGILGDETSNEFWMDLLQLKHL